MQSTAGCFPVYREAFCVLSCKLIRESDLVCWTLESYGFSSEAHIGWKHEISRQGGREDGGSRRSSYPYIWPSPPDLRNDFSVDMENHDRFEKNKQSYYICDTVNISHILIYLIFLPVYSGFFFCWGKYKFLMYPKQEMFYLIILFILAKIFNLVQ